MTPCGPPKLTGQHPFPEWAVRAFWDEMTPKTYPPHLTWSMPAVHLNREGMFAISSAPESLFTKLNVDFPRLPKWLADRVYHANLPRPLHICPPELAPSTLLCWCGHPIAHCPHAARWGEGIVSNMHRLSSLRDKILGWDRQLWGEFPWREGVERDEEIDVFVKPPPPIVRTKDYHYFDPVVYDLVYDLVDEEIPCDLLGWGWCMTHHTYHDGREADLETPSPLQVYPRKPREGG